MNHSDVLENIDPESNYFSSSDLSQLTSPKYVTLSDYAHISKKDFTIMNYNIRSYHANFDSFSTSFETYSHYPQILVLCETWFTTNYTESIAGFNDYHVVRTSNRSGGVSVYVKSEIKSKILPNLSYVDSNIEVCTVEAFFDDTKIFLICIYRPHSGTVTGLINSLEQILNNISYTRSTCIILGDFNINLLHDDPDCNAFTNFLQSYHFISVIDKPTRFHPNGLTLPSLLDQIWTNDLTYTDCGIILLDVTDHCPDYIKFKSNKPNRKTSEKIKITFRSFTESNHISFHQALESFDWTSLPNNDINTYVESFTRVLNNLYNSHFPLLTKLIPKNHSNKPWITPSMTKLLKLKSSYFKLLKLDVVTMHENNSFKNKVTSIIRKSKIEYYKSAFSRSHSNIRGTWRLVNELASRNISNNIINRIIWNNVELADNSEIAEAFSEYFSNVAPTLNDNMPTNDIDPLSFINLNISNSLFLHPISPMECTHIVNSLKNTKENQSIPVPIFKSHLSPLLPTLCDMINLMLSSGEFPSSLKKAVIIPIFKKGDKSLPGNYRPISLLPFLSKIFEKTILKRLAKFTADENLIHPSQYGFIKNSSTINSILDLTENIYSALNLKQININVMIDFQKAFDTVNHKILLSKLGKYGIRGLPLNLISNFLSNRSTTVRIDSEYSQPKPLIIGLPQGSVLSAILFILYINDLPNISNKFKSILFADDTALCFSNTNQNQIYETCNTELMKFFSWTISNRLSVSLEKTRTLTVTTRQNFTPGNISMDTVNLTNEHTFKYLGILLDDKMKFSAHIQYISGKISKGIGILFRIRDCVPHQVLKSLYYSFIFPYLSYGVIIWGGTYDVHLKPLITLQKRSLRIINKKPYREHTNPLFIQNNILKLHDLYKFNLGIHFYKNKLYENLTRTHTYSTRFRSNLLPSFNRLVVTKQSIYEQGAIVWNEIPAPIKNAQTLPKFKRMLKAHFIEQYRPVS